MDESQGCHQPDEKCAGLRSSAFFFANKKPTTMGQLLAQLPEVMLVRDTHLLFATLGSAPNNMLECSETKRPQNACFLYFLVMKKLASVS
jgi:hypothetical protein